MDDVPVAYAGCLDLADEYLAFVIRLESVHRLLARLHRNIAMDHGRHVIDQRVIERGEHVAVVGEHYDLARVLNGVVDQLDAATDLGQADFVPQRRHVLPRHGEFAFELARIIYIGFLDALDAPGGVSQAGAQIGAQALLGQLDDLAALGWQLLQHISLEMPGHQAGEVLTQLVKVGSPVHDHAPFALICTAIAVGVAHE